jgi:DNA sulfur modification protein DndB
MGSRTYFICKMRASELSGSIGVASELQDWNSRELEDIYQRDLNNKRVEQIIAPYLASNPDRFFGSIIVWARDASAIEFESFEQLVGNSPLAYRDALKSLGVIVIGSNGDSTQSGLVALDGQHRLAALRHVVQGKANGEFASAVANDEVTVIFISDPDGVKARALFTILNKTARRVSKNDVLIMSETNGAAMAGRKVTASTLMAPRGLDSLPLVKWDSNTISKKDSQLTTLNALTEIVALVSQHQGIDVSTDDAVETPPSEVELKKAIDATIDWLQIFFSSFASIEAMRHDPNLIVSGREKDQPYSLLLKPVGLIALFSAAKMALDPQIGGLTDLNEVFRRLAKVDWSLSAGIWKNIIVNTKGNIANRQADLDLAAELVVWLICGRSCSQHFQIQLEEKFKRQLNRSDATLPTPVFA